MSFLGTLFQFMSYARYNTSLQTVANAQPQELQCDVNGNLLVNIAAQGGIVGTSWNDFTSGYQGVIKNSAATLWSLYAGNNGASARYLMLFNAVAVPANGATPLMTFPLASNDADYIAFPRGKPFSTGICFAVSSTVATLTADAAALVQVSAEYK